MTDRRLHLGAVAGTVAHHGFELAAGVGLVFQPYLGLPGSAAAWAVALPGWALLALRPEGAATEGSGGAVLADGALSFLAGVSLAGALLHFKLWPVARRPHGKWYGVPVLIEAEGLSERQLPVYNAILYGWTAASVVAIWRGTPGPSRRLAIAGLFSAVPLAASARHHFKWIGEQAADQPAWWNRAGHP